MKVHSSVLTGFDIDKAVTAGGMRGVYAEYTRAGSRSRDHSFNVSLTGNSTRWTNSGHRGAGDEHAALWDEWGIFMQALYEIDPDALIGQYGTLETFTVCTGARFVNLTAPFVCDHKWLSVGGYRNECKWCSATFDYNPIREIVMARRAKKGLAVR